VVNEAQFLTHSKSIKGGVNPHCIHHLMMGQFDHIKKYDTRDPKKKESVRCHPEVALL
jgi:hypothetical protein